MKRLLPLVLVVVGCAKSPFDITPQQAKTVRRMGGPIDLDHLPPGAVKREKVFHKGDRLPDGTISDGERKIVSVTVGR